MLLWGIATIYTLRRFYMLMRRTTIPSPDKKKIRCVKMMLIILIFAFHLPRGTLQLS